MDNLNLIMEQKEIKKSIWTVEEKTQLSAQSLFKS